MNSRKSIIVLGLVIAGVAVLGGRLLLPSLHSASPAQPVQAAPLRGVSALGTLEPSSRVRVVTAPGMNVRMANLDVEVGSWVESGSILGVTDEFELQREELNLREQEVKVARSRLAQTLSGAKPKEIAAKEASIKSAQEALAQRERDWERSRQLMGTGAEAQTQLENDELALATARALLEQAQAERDAVAEIRAVDVHLREQELAVAEAAVKVAQASLDRTKVIAPITGRVLKIHSRSGERVTEEGVLELGNVAPMHAVAEVFEADLPRVSLGQKAVITQKSLGYDA